MATRKTNRGASIDIDALIAKHNPSSPAVGNMKINAKGDQLGANGEVVKKNEQRVREYYRDNPKSSTRTSLKDSRDAPSLPQAKKPAKPDMPVIDEPDEFDAPSEAEPLGYKEVEMPNGDIEMVPYYKEEEK